MGKIATTCIYLISSILLAILGIAFEMYFLYSFHFAFAPILAWGLAIVVISLWIVFAIFFFKGKESVYKSILTVYVLFVFFSALLFVFQKTGLLEILFHREALQDKIAEAGIFAPLVFIILQFLQTIILPLPTALTIAIGVYLFGAWKCFLFSYIGCVTGSIVAFFIGRGLGFKAVAWLFGKETVEGWLKKIKGKDSFILTAMFLLPFFPDDLLCFVAGLSSMTNGYFIAMICISRLISISTTAFPIDFIPFNTWWGLLIWGVIFLVVIVAMIFAYRNQEKIYSFLHKFGKKK